MTKKPALLLFPAAAVLCCLAASAQARPVLSAPAPASFATPAFLEKFPLLQRLFGKKQAAVPEQAQYYIHDDQSFAENTHIAHMRPYSNPAMEFDLAVPKNWEPTDLTKNQDAAHIDQSLLIDNTRLRSEVMGVYNVTVTVSSQALKHEISARSWLKNYILSSGYALEDDLVELGPYKATAYYSSSSDKGDMRTYISAQITGDIVMVVRCETPLPIKDYAAYIQKKLIDTFQISYPRTTNVEQGKPFTLVDAATFSYPTSWEIEDPDFKDLTRLSVGLRSRNVNGATDGFIKIFVIRRTGATSLQKEIAVMRQHFSEFLGINVTKLISSGKADASGRFPFSRYEVYAAAYKKEGHADPAVRLVALGDKDWYVFAYLISPKEQDNLPVWGRNTRTFELIMKSLH